jgi:hypothetical protein
VVARLFLSVSLLILDIYAWQQADFLPRSDAEKRHGGSGEGQPNA